ncbi:hypothetical protein [Micromonospora sp. NPDC049679]|uniref:hypothetical protein n=1 Tax=Micromonospora sp. NPDC049679 TaxID=3155920 RepID=UPI0033DF11A1
MSPVNPARAMTRLPVPQKSSNLTRRRLEPEFRLRPTTIVPLATALTTRPTLNGHCVFIVDRTPARHIRGQTVPANLAPDADGFTWVHLHVTAVRPHEWGSAPPPTRITLSGGHDEINTSATSEQ